MPLPRPVSDSSLHGKGRLTAAGSVAVRDFNKDRLAAQDLARRCDRLEALKARRRPSALVAAVENPAVAPPLARAPRRLSTLQRPKATGSSRSEDWHKLRVESVFAELDPKNLGEVSVATLQASFAEMNIALDSETFAKYKHQILPKGCESVTLEQFRKFHEVVWENQPPSVRRFAGCPEAGADGTGSLHVGLSPHAKSQASLRELPKMRLPGPSKGLYKEAMENEDALRAAFYRYTNGNLYLSRSQMPTVLKDLGMTLPAQGSTQLDKDFFQTFCDHEFDNADENKDGKVSFQECVAYQNRYLSMMQATSLGIIKSFRSSVLHNTDE
mmetsp:Transcript_37981/g.84905  ORF Transcript_37981/g.84905 Transcript_37981/m.84905 type:complete len:328 (-) Transcript_37981:178-1161(-)